MHELSKRRLIPILNDLVLDQRRPVLGICLGMQLLAKRSEEGVLPGLGWLDSDVIRFDFKAAELRQLKVPHIGWNYVRPETAHPLFQGLDQPRFYFVHSYHVCCRESHNVIGTTRYGIDFTSAVARDNVMGTQFHPEKSHRFGMGLLRNFLAYVEAKNDQASSNTLSAA
jgi:glutamine amidotransferase